MGRVPTPESRERESGIQKAITDLLTAKRILWFRMNSSKQLLSYTNKAGETKRRVLRGHEKGTADLLALPVVVESCDFRFQTMEHAALSNPLWIEVKASGKKQRPEQVEFQKRVEAYGCSYIVADSVDKVVDWLKERGL